MEAVDYFVSALEAMEELACDTCVHEVLYQRSEDNETNLTHPSCQLIAAMFAKMDVPQHTFTVVQNENTDDVTATCSEYLQAIPELIKFLDTPLVLPLVGQLTFDGGEVVSVDDKIVIEYKEQS